MTEVVLENLSKRFGTVVAVDDIDLRISDQEFVVLVGPSGCGKSTTLRMIAGLETPSAGAIHFGEHNVTHVPAKDRNLAMVFQNYALYPHMNVRENMAFGLKLKKVSRNEIDIRIQQAAETLGIEELLKRKPNQLSGGQKQRVALGRAIVRVPGLFLFDEPLSNLDAKLRSTMRSELIRLHQRLQATMIYVTHDQAEAMTMGDRIVVMKDGQIQQVGTPRDIYSKPVNRFVAEFIGQPAMNFLEGKLQIVEGQTKIDCGDFEFPLLESIKTSRKAPQPNQKVLVGIRPEELVLANSRPADQRHAQLTATVEMTQLLGGEQLWELNTGRQNLTAKVDGRADVSVGERVELLIDVERIHLFDSETEQAI
jgi:multiple sugar transport system ATP-binding protein